LHRHDGMGLRAVDGCHEHSRPMTLVGEARRSHCGKLPERERSFHVIKPGGILVSVVSNASPPPDAPASVRSVFFLVNVTTQRLERLTGSFNRGELNVRVGAVLPLDHAGEAHEMLAGAPRPSGKIVLNIWDPRWVRASLLLFASAVAFKEAFELFFEFADVFEVAVDRCEADVGDGI